MIEYTMTKQAADGEWKPVEGADAQQRPLHPPAGDDWELNTFVQGEAGIVAVWQRRKHSAALSEAYEIPKDDAKV